MLIAITALASSAIAHLRTDLARRVARDLLTTFVSSEIRGSIAIGRIDRLELGRVVARNVSLFDPKGVRIVTADEIILVPDNLLSLLDNRLRFKSATLKRGRLRLVRTESGAPTFFDTFEPADSSVSSTEPLRAVVDDIRLYEITVYGDIYALDKMRSQQVTAHGRLEVKQDLEIEIFDAKGVFTAPFPFDGYVEALKGTISSNAHHGIALAFDARRESERASVSVKLFRPESDQQQEQQRLELRIQGAPVSPATIRGLGFDFTGPFEPALTGSFSLLGPLDDLALEADLKSSAGNGVVSGRISKTQGVSVTLRTPGIQLDRVFQDAPAITVAGSSAITISPEQTHPRVRLQVEPVLFQAIAIPSFELEGQLQPDRLQIDRIFSKQKGSEISGEGAVDFDGRLDLQFRARIAEIGRDKNVRRHMPGAQGALDADVHFITPGFESRQMKFQGRVSLRDLHYGPLTAEKLTLNGSAHGDPDLPLVKLKVAGEGIALSAFPVGDTEFNLVGGPGEYQAVGRVRVKDQQTFQLDARVNADKNGFVLNAEHIELIVGDRSWRGTALNLRLIKNKLVSLELLRLASQSQRLETQATIRFRGSDQVSAQLQDFDLSVLHTLFGKRFVLREGRADANLQLSGDIKRPEISIQGALRGGSLLDLKDVSGVYMLSYQNGRLDIDAEADLGKRGVVGVTGNGLLDTNRADLIQELYNIDYNLTFRASDLDLSIAVKAAAIPVEKTTGRVDGEMVAMGTLYRPTFSGWLKFEPITVADFAPLSVEAKFNFQRDQFDTQLAIADRNGAVGELSAETALKWDELLNGTYHLAEAVAQGPWSISGHSARRRLDALPEPVGKKLPWPFDLETRFRASREDAKTYAEIAFDGQWVARFEGSDCAADQRPILTGQVVLYDDMTHFTVSAYNGEKRFAELEGTAGTPVEKWIERGEFTGLTALSTIGQIKIDSIEAFPWLCEYGTGSLSAKLDIDDLLTERVHGRIDLSSSFSFMGRTPEERTRRKQPIQPKLSCVKDPFRVDLDLILNPGDVQATGSISGCGSTDGRIKASLPVSWTNRVPLPQLKKNKELVAELSFDQAEIKPLLEMVPQLSDGTGLFKGSIVARGKPDRIGLNGRLDIVRASFKLTSTGQRFSEIEGGFIFRGNWVEVHKLAAHDADGTLRLTGGIGLENLLPRRMRLALFLDDFPVQRESVPLAWLSGNASIETEIMQHRAATSLLIESLDIRLPETSTRSLQSLDPHPDIKILGLDDSVVQARSPYTFQINVDGSDTLISVQRSDFTAAVEAQLDVIYLEPELRVAGEVDFKRGVFEVLGKKFDLNTGRLSFKGSPQLNPEVSLRATHSPYGEDSGSVVATVSGTMRRPKVAFYSDECQGEEGALTLLLTGSCALNENEMATDPQQYDQQKNMFLAGAAGGILSLGTSGIRREMNDLFPTFSVDTVGESEGERGYRLQAGINADSLIPKFIRSIVRHAYIQGGLGSSTGEGQNSASASSQSDTVDNVDFLLELRFPFDLVWTGEVSRSNRLGSETLQLGSDILWEP